MLSFSPILTMPVLLGTLTYKRNFQINYTFFRTSALYFVYPWVTDLTLGLNSLKKLIGFQLGIDLNKMLQPISSNNKINWPQSTWMKYLPPLTYAISKPGHLLIDGGLIKFFKFLEIQHTNDKRN